MVSDKIALVRNIIFSTERGVEIEYEAFDTIKPFCEYPLKSTNLGIYPCGPPEVGIYRSSINCVTRKMSMFTL